jgi:phosphoglycolate phosphatase-like HAD superfamily hydrolase
MQILALAALSLFSALASSSTEPLSSWNDPYRSTYLSYLREVTDPKSPTFIPTEDRIAAFDFDGTVISEKPDSLEAALTNTRLLEKLKADPTLINRPVYKAVKTKDEKYFDSLDHVLDKIAEAFTGERIEAYQKYLSDFYANYKNEKFGRTYKNLYFLPMLELIDYLKENGFEVYLCSGTQTFLLKVVARDAHIKPENGLGTTIAFDFIESSKEAGGTSIFVMANKTFPPSANVEFKPVKVFERTGRRPVFAFGNSIKDRFLLKSASDSSYRHMANILDHDDPKEAVYRADALLKLAKESHWMIVSMKNAFKKLW